ncbi:MAG: hypothetical protein AVDCRST_MAG93-827 [uncultured Chloroflexia bacterium]|uniref:Uncharacterized protein n=1 Tax=uncultured Chloroflexia bacterium TaxID=1672391 RepID=A0A6J4HQ22_9CHLR|nr:MAG: hypothetical protein AVDCRST_MAG93-827 [uncultured Chloroflexia bacterium]
MHRRIISIIPILLMLSVFSRDHSTATAQSPCSSKECTVYLPLVFGNPVFVELEVVSMNQTVSSDYRTTYVSGEIRNNHSRMVSSIQVIVHGRECSHYEPYDCFDRVNDGNPDKTILAPGETTRYFTTFTDGHASRVRATGVYSP